MIATAEKVRNKLLFFSQASRRWILCVDFCVRSRSVWAATVCAVGAARGPRPQPLQVHLPEKLRRHAVAGDDLPGRRPHVAAELASRAGHGEEHQDHQEHYRHGSKPSRHHDSSWLACASLLFYHSIGRRLDSCWLLHKRTN